MLKAELPGSGRHAERGRKLAATGRVAVLANHLPALPIDLHDRPFVGKDINTVFPIGFQFTVLE